MATPLRFRHSTESWSEGRVRGQLLQPLQSNIGAREVEPRFELGGPWIAHRFEMDNGDLALFARGEGEAYWMGNTETPRALWRTDKYGWDEVPYPVARWAQRELLADLHDEDPWLAAYPHVSWFFLPVFMSKDGRETTRAFFRDHAGGFPDADADSVLAFLEEFLRTGVLDEYREEMAGKLGTSEGLDLTRMTAAMGEYVAAWVLTEAGYAIEPEIEVTTGHSLDFRARNGATDVLVEVTRPLPPSRRSANTAVAAIKDTVRNKTADQLAHHGGGAILFVDCSSFPDDAWPAIAADRPDLGHRPAVVYRVRPTGQAVGYAKGAVQLDLDGVIEWVDGS